MLIFYQGRKLIYSEYFVNLCELYLYREKRRSFEKLFLIIVHQNGSKVLLYFIRYFSNKWRFVRKFILITQTYDAYSENPLKRILGKCARIFKTDFQRSSMRKRFDLFFDNTHSCRNIYFDSPSARSWKSLNWIFSRLKNN